MSLTTLLSNFSIPFQWWVVIAPWERGVRVRRGSRATELRPGLHLKIPFLDRVYVASVRTRMISDTGQTMRTKDGVPITVNIAIQFAVRDVLTLFNSIANPELTIALRAQAAIAIAIGNRSLADLDRHTMEQEAIEQIPVARWGLDDFDIRVTTLVQARVLRLIMHEYRSTSGLDELLAADDKRRGGE